MSVLTKCYAKDRGLVTRNVAGETIIVPIKNNVGDLNSIFTLNEVGTTIWELIDGKNSVREIAEAICKTYEVIPEVAEKDAIDFLRSIEEAGLIRFIGVK
jgi:hypothetical protein